MRRQRSLSENHGKAQLATSCPAASAITWLLADEPRLAERGQVLLMPADLPQRKRVTLEQVGYTRPVVQETPDPGQADQTDAELDAARPVNT